MKLLIQRVTRAVVRVGGEEVGRIGRGFAVLVGIQVGDMDSNARTLAEKTAALRVFPDTEGKMNRSLLDTGGSVLVLPQFTLCADTRKGHRPGFADAARPGRAEPLLDAYVGALRSRLGSARVKTGRFGADMRVALVLDGPVTLELKCESGPEANP